MATRICLKIKELHSSARIGEELSEIKLYWGKILVQSILLLGFE